GRVGARHAVRAGVCRRRFARAALLDAGRAGARAREGACIGRVGAAHAARCADEARVMHQLLAESSRQRLRAVRELAASPALAYALRRVLYTDRHAEVRAAAARRLGRIEVAGSAGWLVDALGDGSALVRESNLRALARCGGAGARDGVRARIAEDR